MDVELECSECGEVLGMVSEETAGHIGTCSLCDSCDKKALAEIFDH
jgi:hypothetical protein